MVEQATSLIGCSIMSNKFRYLGVMVGEYSSRIKAWDDVILKLRSRLSKWKVKTLSIGGRLTLLKSVLGASPIYNMSIFKVPTGVLKVMESIRSRFFNGADQSEKKVTWVAWNKVLASKKHGGLGVSSFFALNRALLLKWVWRFVSQDGSLWYKVIRALYGSSVETHSTSLSSNWCSIMREVNKLKGKGFDFWSHCKKRIGNGDDSRFWFDCWIGDVPLRVKFPRLFALDLNKEASVAVKLSAPIDISFRRNARGGIEEHLLADLTSLMDSVTLSNSGDRWVCDLVSDGNFRVKEIRNYIDDLFLPHQAAQTRWIKYIPIKVNIFAWRARQDCLPTRVNLIRRGITIESSLCPVCSVCEEDVCHIFFRCDLAQLVLRRICRWWGLDPHDWSSFQEWQSWILSIQFSSKEHVIGLFISFDVEKCFSLMASYLRQLHASTTRVCDFAHPDYHSKTDTSLFVYHMGSDVAYLLLYVDDIILTASSTALLQRIITLLHSEFAMTDLGSLNYFLGVSTQRSKSGLFLSQSKFVEKILERAHMQHCNLCKTPVDTESELGSDGDPVSDPTLYRSLAGALQYLTFTHPDISYDVQQICLYMHDPRDPHFTALKHADWAGCPVTRRSTSGYCVFLGDNLLSWSAKRQVTLSRSSAEAEYRGVANVVAETAWIRNLLLELHTPLSTATLVYCDNVSAVYLSTNPVQHQRTKHIEIDIHFVREYVASGQVRVLHVPSRFQYADIFTKGLPTALFLEFRSSLNVRRSPAHTEGEY
ncbi:RNA-directed DNA polymerase, eukaryota [Tanacetum coccineum]|uniref:RNA-directed DNA polymerase, eukaryota n=1 Tax=Tanacetum coccineum TaxID=301880 RepID=A0ABQ4ZXE5_9ASTR